MSRQGKIARLPHRLREEVCCRLLDGQTSSQILPWLNAEPDAVQIWLDQFEGVPASAQNLSEWRQGGYREWRGRRERVENLKTLSKFSVELAKAGGSVADGAASILGGQILEALEAGAAFMSSTSDKDADTDTDPNKGLATMAQAVAALQRSATAKGKLELDKKRVRQKDKSLALDLAKFERQTVVKFLEWAKSPAATAILDSGKPQHVQMDALRELMFGAEHKGGIK